MPMLMPRRTDSDAGLLQIEAIEHQVLQVPLVLALPLLALRPGAPPRLIQLCKLGQRRNGLAIVNVILDVSYSIAWRCGYIISPE